MLRKIVVLREQDSLKKGWQEKSIAPAQGMLDKEIQVKGLEIDGGYFPVSIPGLPAITEIRVAAEGFRYDDLYRTGSAYGVRVQAEDEEAISRLRHDRRYQVLGVYADPSISVFPTPYCGRAAVGNSSEVFNKLGMRTLQRENLTGKKVRIAVVDSGVNGKVVPVAGGWSLDVDYVPGTAPSDHGTMVAFDAQIAAPEATILDYALLRSARNNSWTGFLSDAIAAFADLRELITSRAPGPLVVNNSWGMYNRAEDAPVGSPENYSLNFDHPFNQIVRALVMAGADVFFAAGNCGGHCPDARCGEMDRGPGASIHGANSHPDVITVAAVTVTDRRLGYSSQGPGGLDPQKPDLAAYSHFAGSGVYPVDVGTSAACPVAAGVAAALRQKFTLARLTPAQLKGALLRSATDLEGDGWDYNLGFGIINAAEAWKSLSTTLLASRRLRRASRLSKASRAAKSRAIS
jgi:subtilisin family serine protease